MSVVVNTFINVLNMFLTTFMNVLTILILRLVYIPETLLKSQVFKASD